MIFSCGKCEQWSNINWERTSDGAIILVLACWKRTWTLNDMEPVYHSMGISTDSHCTDNLRWTHHTDLGSSTSTQANPFKFKIVVTELPHIIFTESPPKNKKKNKSLIAISDVWSIHIKGLIAIRFIAITILFPKEEWIMYRNSMHFLSEILKVNFKYNLR